MSELFSQSLTVEALALSPAEARAYPRWYTDLLLRKRSESIAIGDTLAFVTNFGLTAQDKQTLLSLFGGRPVTLEPAQFYAFLRLAAHCLQGKQLRRELAFVAAPVPKPRSIMAKRKAEKSKAHDPSAKSNPFRSVDGGGPSDMDSFMNLMSGKPATSASRTQSRRKRVTFDSQPPQVAEAAHRSMEELLRQRQLYAQIPAQPPPMQMPDPDPEPETEPEPEMPMPHNQFAHVNIDSVLHHGTSIVPPAPPPRKLTPNMTGPTQMKQFQAGDSFINELQHSHVNQPEPTTPTVRLVSPPASTPAPAAAPNPNHFGTSTMGSGPGPVQRLRAQSTGSLNPMPTSSMSLRHQSTGMLAPPQHLSPQLTPQYQSGPLHAQLTGYSGQQYGQSAAGMTSMQPPSSQSFAQPKQSAVPMMHQQLSPQLTPLGGHSSVQYGYQQQYPQNNLAVPDSTQQQQQQQQMNMSGSYANQQRISPMGTGQYNQQRISPMTTGQFGAAPSVQQSITQSMQQPMQMYMTQQQPSFGQDLGPARGMQFLSAVSQPVAQPQNAGNAFQMGQLRDQIGRW